MIALDPGRIADLPLSLAPGDPTPYHVLVFRGRLGEEENAVVGQVFALPHVQIVQHAYDADISRTCTSQRFSPTFIVPLREVLSCSWQPINHRLEGSLVTNFADSAAANLLDPAIERIEAFWTGSLGGPAPLTVNGVRYAMGVWQRQGNEPNPERFGIADPAQRRDSRLTLTVFLRGGERFSTQLATFKGVVTAAEKAVRTVFLGTTAERWLVVSRTTRVEPNVDGSSFSLVSIGGYPVPTPLRLGEQLAFNLWRDALEVTSLSGFQNLVDVFERFPFAPTTAYETRWAEIALDPPFPQAPELHWSAMVRPRAPQPGALQFWQAFVASGDPPSTAIALTGHQPAAP